MYVNTTGDVAAPNNYWGGDVADKVQGETVADVTGLDNVKDEPVIDEPTTSSSDQSGSSSTSEPSTSSDNSTSSNSSSTTSNPETADNIALPLSIGALLAVSGAAAIISIRRRKSE